MLVRARRCAINVFGRYWHSAELGQIPSCPFVCAPSSSFVFVCNVASSWQVSDSLGQIPSHCARSSALGQFMSGARAMTRVFKYWIPWLKNEKNEMFLRSRKLTKKRTESVNSKTNTWSVKKRKLEAHETFEFVRLRRTRYSRNTPEFGDRNTCSQADRGPFPSAAMIVEAYGKLSSGGEGRLTSRHQQASDTTKCSLERQKIFSYKLVLSDINKFAKCKAERAGCRWADRLTCSACAGT